MRNVSAVDLDAKNAMSLRKMRWYYHAKKHVDTDREFFPKELFPLISARTSCLGIIEIPFSLPTMEKVTITIMYSMQ
jgi:hypothetical protein